MATGPNGEDGGDWLAPGDGTTQPERFINHAACPTGGAAIASES